MKIWQIIFPLRALVVLLTVALATTGFAHRAPSQTDQAVLDYAALFGIDAASICGGSDDPGATQKCEACRLQAAMALPEPPLVTSVAELSFSPPHWGPQSHVLETLSAEATRPARAPPIV